MYYTDISILFMASIVTAVLAVSNLVRGYRIGINKLYSLVCFFALAFFGSLLFLTIFRNSSLVEQGFRIFLVLGLFLVQLSFHLSQVYPPWERKPQLWLIGLSFLPGFAAALVTILTNIIVVSVTTGEILQYNFGTYAYVYGIVVVSYSIGFVANMLFKARNLENRSFKSQMMLIAAGYIVCALAVFAVLFILPVYFENLEFRKSGITAAVLLFLIIYYYAVSRERQIDFRKYYLRLIFWFFVVALLFIPSFLIIHYNTVIAGSGNKIPTAAIAIFIFIYLFLFYRFGRPQLERLVRRNETLFEQNVNEFFQELSEISNESGQHRFWDVFFEKSILPLETRFLIGRASLFLKSTGEEDLEYGYSYGYGDKFNFKEINPDGKLIQCLGEYSGLIHVSYFFTDEKLSGYKSYLYSKLNEEGIEVILPFLDYNKVMIGILCLGSLKNGHPYPVMLLNALDVYRIQFELSLANALVLEEVKNTQIIEHDKLVLNSIKNRLIPKELRGNEGIRMSSIYINNSDHGGDYFDSVLLGPGSVGVFICDTSDAGVESGLMALELYSVLHNDPEKYDTPDKMLNVMNWVISTSRLSDKYVQAFYMIYNSRTREISYSGAAFNPGIFYDAGKDSFFEMETKGIPLGIDRNFIYETKTIKVLSGGMGFLYSDGLTSSPRKEGGSLGPGSVKDLIRLNSSDSPAVIARKVYNEYTEPGESAALKNDLSLIIFRVVV